MVSMCCTSQSVKLQDWSDSEEKVVFTKRYSLLLWACMFPTLGISILSWRDDVPTWRAQRRAVVGPGPVEGEAEDILRERSDYQALGWTRSLTCRVEDLSMLPGADQTESPQSGLESSRLRSPAVMDLMESHEVRRSRRDSRDLRGWRKGLGRSRRDSNDLTTFFTDSALSLRLSLRCLLAP